MRLHGIVVHGGPTEVMLTNTVWVLFKCVPQGRHMLQARFSVQRYYEVGGTCKRWKAMENGISCL